MTSAGVADLQRIADEMVQLDDFVICGHVSPDGDCLGSALGLMWALRALGKNAVCLLAKDDPIEYGLMTLPGIDEMAIAASYEGTPSVFVTVDVPNAKRMGTAAARLHRRAGRTMTLDHHLSDVPLSELSYIDSTAPACAMIVWELIHMLGVKPDVRMATCCYTGLVTDTGRFQFQNTNKECFIDAADMVDCGADPATVARDVYQNRTVESLKLEDIVISHMEFFGDGAHVVSYLTQEDFKRTGAVKSDAEPLINTLRSLRGVRVACVLREQDKDVRGSLRAKDDTDVAAIAASIGGGGHRAAAGFTFDGTLDEARRCIAQVFAKLESE